MIPVDLLVTEARPAVRLALLDKFIERTVARAVKQRLARVAVVKGELAGSGRLLLKKGGRALPVGAVLGVVAVEGADLAKEIAKKVNEDFDQKKLPLMLGMINAIVEDKKLELDWESFR